MQTLLGSNKKTGKLLRYLLANPGDEIRVRKIASKLKINPGSVSVFVGKMRKDGLVKGGFLNMDSPRVHALKILFNVDGIAPLAREIAKMTKALGVGVYGSWIKGANTEKSDLDLWVKVKERPGTIEIARTRAAIRKKLGVEPSLIFIDARKLEELKKNNPPLYFSLVHSFHLWGEWID